MAMPNHAGRRIPSRRSARRATRGSIRFTPATTTRNSNDSPVPTTERNARTGSNSEAKSRSRRATASVKTEYHCRVPEREKHPERHRAASGLHHLAGRIVDRGDMIRVRRVAQAEPVGEHGGADQRRTSLKATQTHSQTRPFAAGEQKHHDDASGAGAKPWSGRVEAAEGSPSRPRSSACRQAQATSCLTRRPRPRRWCRQRSVIFAVARPRNAPMNIEIGSAMSALSNDSENSALVSSRSGVCTR